MSHQTGRRSAPRAIEVERQDPSRILWTVILAALALTMLAFLPTPAQGQISSTGINQADTRPKVFLDCQARRNCDSTHFRTEIQFVEWVRDRSDADLHVIFTATGAGGGGMQYTLDFIGLRAVAGMDDQLTYTSLGTDVGAEVMDGLTQTFRMGLLRYAVEMGQGRNFSVEFLGARVNDEMGGDMGSSASGEASAPFRDPWNYWTFRFGLSGNMDIQERRSEQRINPSLSANRVTEAWKVDFSFWSNFRRQTIELSDGREIRNDQDSWRVGGLLVRSISDHVSVGIDAGASNSINQNRRARVNVQPAVEWNYYPYMQANRRQFIAHYAAGLEYSNYYEETVFGSLTETLPQHRFAFQYRAREQWGNAGLGFESSQYLHDTDLYSYGLSGDVSYRISRGLELNVSGDASRVNDQIHVAASNFSDEDILLGRVSLPTGYRYQASVGFNYRWGSSVTNVVNNRFPRSVR
ncbi:MAG: hypothetical protein EA351_13160 [Gemmatimonadales bacterium]|nr:MAG: hypothetical protein EA351_13160 [Gemmatimonadales bacterium]